ncbi:MAG: N-acetylmuramoyl-L-alanine amidase [Lachnospirales bacterium]
MSHTELEGSYDLPKTSIYNISYTNPSAIKNSETVVISATSPISSVTETLTEDGRLALDFNNASYDIKSHNIGLVYNSSLDETRGSSYSENVARVVLPLKSSVYYTLQYSYDRTSVIVTFIEGTITDYSMYNNSLSVFGDKSFTPEFTTLTNPLRLVMDVPTMQLDGLYTREQLVTNTGFSDFVSSVFVSQYAPNTTRFTFNITRDFTYEITQRDKNFTIAIEDMSDTPLYYSSINDYLVINESFLSSPIDINSIEVTEYLTYHENNVTFDLPTTINGIYGDYVYEVDNDVIDNISYSGQGTSSQIVVNLNKPRAFELSDNGDSWTFTPKLVSEVYDKVVLLDAGHGGTDPGTTYGSYQEKEIVLDITKRAEKVLNEQYPDENIKVYLSRRIDTIIPLYSIPEYKDEMQPDMFVSVHVNSAGGITSANGTETYYKESHSYDLAKVFHKHLLAKMGTSDRKVKNSNFVVIRDTDIPSVLLEIAFISNYSDRQKLMSSEYRDYTAEAIAAGVVEGFTVIN